MTGIFIGLMVLVVLAALFALLYTVIRPPATRKVPWWAPGPAPPRQALPVDFELELHEGVFGRLVYSLLCILYFGLMGWITSMLWQEVQSGVTGGRQAVAFALIYGLFGVVVLWLFILSWRWRLTAGHQFFRVRGVKREREYAFRQVRVCHIGRPRRGRLRMQLRFDDGKSFEIPVSIRGSDVFFAALQSHGVPVVYQPALAAQFKQRQ